MVWNQEQFLDYDTKEINGSLYFLLIFIMGQKFPVWFWRM